MNEIGQTLLARVREQINQEWGHGLLECDQCAAQYDADEFVAGAACLDCGGTLRGTLQDAFTTTFLRPRDGCVPEEYLDSEDIKNSITLLFGFIFWPIADALEEATGVIVQTCIEPDYWNETRVVMYSEEPRALLLTVWCKAWNLWWESEEEIIADLETWYTRALTALKQARVPAEDIHRLAVEAVTDIADYFFDYDEEARELGPGYEVACPHCGQDTEIGQEECQHCGASFPGGLSKNQIVFDDAVSRVEQAIRQALVGQQPETARYAVEQFDRDTFMVVDRRENREICICNNYEGADDAEIRAHRIAAALANT